MDLDFSDQQKTLRDELARLLGAHPGLRSARGALEGTAPYDAALWRELGRLGWLSIAMPEAYGGQALGYEMLCCAAGEIGRSLAALPVASSIFMAAEAIRLFGSEGQRQSLLPALGAGETIGALAIAESAGALGPHAIAAYVEHGRLSGIKIAVADGMIADTLVVVALLAGEPQLFVVEAADPGVTRIARTGIDPSHAPAEIRFENAQAERLGNAGWAGITRLLDRAAILIAFEQIGTADAALDLATNYAKERHAFGRVVGSFQAIKHKLADVWIAIELARANAYYAAWALDTDAETLPLAAATARVSASEALERAARELIQVHGGIAVTWAHDAHLFYRRGQHLGLLLGGVREWQDRLTEHLAAAA